MTGVQTCALPILQQLIDDTEELRIGADDVRALGATGRKRMHNRLEIGRASCRERVCSTV